MSDILQSNPTGPPAVTAVQELMDTLSERGIFFPHAQNVQDNAGEGSNTSQQVPEVSQSSSQGRPHPLASYIPGPGIGDIQLTFHPAELTDLEFGVVDFVSIKIRASGWFDIPPPQGHPVEFRSDGRPSAWCIAMITDENDRNVEAEDVLHDGYFRVERAKALVVDAGAGRMIARPERAGSGHGNDAFTDYEFRWTFKSAGIGRRDAHTDAFRQGKNKVGRAFTLSFLVTAYIGELQYEGVVSKSVAVWTNVRSRSVRTLPDASG